MFNTSNNKKMFLLIVSIFLFSIISCLNVNAAINHVTAGVQIEGNHLYVAYWEEEFDNGAIQVFDLSNPANPDLLCTFMTDFCIADFYVDGQLVYLLDRGYNFYIASFENLMQPQILSSLSLQIFLRYFVVSNKIAYLVGDHIQLVNVSDPSNPIDEGTQLLIEEKVFDIQINNDLAFLSCVEHGIRIYDISDPLYLNFIGSYDSGETYKVYPEANTAFICSVNNFEIIDIINPLSPSQISNLTLPSSSYPRDITLDGNTVYLSCLYSGVHIIDISNLANPTLISTYSEDIEFPSQHGAMGIALKDHYAYIAYGLSGLRVIDIQTLGSPEYIKTINFRYGSQIFHQKLFTPTFIVGLVVLTIGLTLGTLILTKYRKYFNDASILLTLFIIQTGIFLISLSLLKEFRYYNPIDFSEDKRTRILSAEGLVFGVASIIFSMKGLRSKITKEEREKSVLLILVGIFAIVVVLILCLFVPFQLSIGF